MSETRCEHWFRTIERGGKWVTSCEYCGQIYVERVAERRKYHEWSEQTDRETGGIDRRSYKDRRSAQSGAEVQP